MARPKTTSPQHLGMVEVNSKNRSKLEKQYGITIPEDVTYIIPPNVVNDQLGDDLFWDEVRRIKHGQKRLDKPEVS